MLVLHSLEKIYLILENLEREEWDMKLGAFDIDKKKIGKIIEGVKVEDIKNLKTIIKRKKVKIALLCTPPHSAQEVCNKLVDAGIRGILNFSPLMLKVPSSVFVSNVDMACELESLIFFLKRNETKF